MNLADKPCYPLNGIYDVQYRKDGIREYPQEGLTFRERLVIALASNPYVVSREININAMTPINEADNAIAIIRQADTIIQKMEVK